MEPYVFAEVVAPQGAPLLFLLHGTGGDENDLLDLGRLVWPGARLNSPRGDVSENGAPRFFRRLGMGIYDMADLGRATEKLAGFMRQQVQRLRPSTVAALGYSNGANILAAILVSEPRLLDRTVLMHPLIPFDPPAQPELAGRRVLITAGRHDPIAPPLGTERLAAYFRAQGAAVELAMHDGGHQLRQEEIETAQAFLAA